MHIHVSQQNKEEKDTKKERAHNIDEAAVVILMFYSIPYYCLYFQFFLMKKQTHVLAGITKAYKTDSWIDRQMDRLKD